MEIRVTTVVESVMTTLSAMYIDDEFQCWVLEDAEQEQKVKGETRISEGRYPLDVRKGSPMAKRYDKRFESINHDGMLWLRGVPDFKWVYFHIGNKHKDTDGCLLVGDGVGRGAFGVASTITNSTNAYLRIYPIIMEAIAEGEPVFVTIDRGGKRTNKESFVEGFVQGSRASLDLIREFTNVLENKGVDLIGEVREMALDIWKKKESKNE